MAWVPERATGDLLPFWLGPELEDVLRGLHPNEPAPSSVPEKVRCVLAAANILFLKTTQVSANVPGK